MTTQNAIGPIVVRAPRAPRAMPSTETLIRLKTWTPLRQALPASALLARAERQARQSWALDGEERREAIASMATIVTGTPREPDLMAIARRHLIEMFAGRVLFWERWEPPTVDPATAEHLQSALASGGGLVLSACHTGPYYRSLLTFHARGRTAWAVSGTWFFEPPTPDYWGRRLAHWWNETRTNLIEARGSRETIRRLLLAGEIVNICFDMPGPRPTQFLGKPMMLAEGTARLAVETGALILPMRIRRVGHGALQQFAPPIDARDFAGVEDVHHAVAAVHERWILEDPSPMTDPRGFGWKRWATPDRWIAPKPEIPGPDLAAG